MRILIHTNGNPLKLAGGYSGQIRKLGRIFNENSENEVIFFLTCFGKTSGQLIKLDDIKLKERTNLSSIDPIERKMLYDS